MKTITFDVQIPNLDGDGIANTVPVDVQVYTDPDTGAEVLTPESLELIEKTQARHMGLMPAEDIRNLRENRLKLTQEDMSELLQIGAKTYTRWESGRARPSRSMNVLLRAIDDGQIDVTYLRCLRDPAARNEWLTRKHLRHVFLAHASHPDADHQMALEIALAQSCLSPGATISEWQHLTGCKITDIESSSKKCWYAVIPHQHDEPSPETPFRTPRLPSQREQRQNFMNARFDMSQFNDPLQKGA